jgi:hypothetical protein
VWECEVERLCDLHIDDQIELGRLFYGQVAWPVTLKNPADIVAHTAIPVEKIRAVAHQPTGCGLLAKRIDCGHSNATCRQNSL